ncbi:MAG: Crossover junction endodeoxyribonuclease RuvC [candidate division CPR2 bacterium GW2011_GWC1_39_9]|uniref:Crossover junction endodeoxyribonuclease RuvC n=1 Tax=candidate division CPR2 bacterium GW2011_GWC2_39_10 TaxID=1618345 RepID=A0A0G0LSR1_UNCC2|nr:MAG: Crossover junction endodeoxyribonuclease RuvC [candidate division CPR2 bacterium GW2011_GWC2_39_10]KKR34785.1 MAG: Crossover junction endodeoxyribonuclease RuvC [candidate division CPR2 bacterium GW2011_GWC1_39_9]
MIILGIDPGTATTGYGVIKKEGNVLTVLEYGCIRTEANLDLKIRLRIIEEDLIEIIESFKPDVASVEQLFFCNNAKTALSVGHARGVILLVLAKNEIPSFEYTPLQVKQTISGYGKASKKQIQEMVKILLKMKEIPRPDDAADALAIAMCHLQNANFIDKISQNS